MKKRLKSFITGLICGAFLLSGIGYAANKFQIEVQLPYIPYIYDGKEINVGNDDELNPQTINYNHVNYVSVRALAEALGKEVEWDAQTGEVLIHSVEQLAFETVKEEDMTSDIAAWVERSINKEGTTLRTVGDDTFILLAMGEKPSGGYEINVSEVKQYFNGVTVHADFISPDKGMLVTSEITYPYSVIKIAGTISGPIQVIDHASFVQ